MALTKDDVAQVALLTRLDLTDDEAARTARQLSSVLDYIAKLNELNTDDTEPMFHPMPLQNVFREDEPSPSLPVAEALKNAPERLGDSFRVPRVIE